MWQIFFNCSVCQPVVTLAIVGNLFIISSKMISIHKQNLTVAGQSSEHFPEQIDVDGTDNQSQTTVSSQSVIPSVSHKSCSNAGPLPGSMRKGAATATATATLVHDVTASSLPTGNVPVF